MIKTWGKVSTISPAMLAAADEIKHLNYKTTTPARFRKNVLTDDLAADLMEEISGIIGVPTVKLDYVYFSAARGAETHTDLLPPEVFTHRTFVIPIILPKGDTVIIAEDSRVSVEIGEIYEFNHEKPHSMTVEDTETGCVVVMVSIKH